MIELSDQFLKRIAGTAIFEAAHRIVDAGDVGEWQRQGHSITASVTDSQTGEPYRPTIIHTHNTLDAACACEQSDGIDVCPHSIALALVWRDWLAAQQRAKLGSDTERLTQYIDGLPRETLSTALRELIDADPVLTQQWLLRADRALGTLDSQQLRKRINQIFTPQLRTTAAVKAVAECSELLADVAGDIAPDQQAELCAYALQRFAQHEHIELIASDTEQSIASLQQLLIRGFETSEWTTAIKTAFLLELLASPQPELLPQLPEDFVETLDEDARIFVYDAIRDAWESAINNNDMQHLEPVLRSAVLRRAERLGDRETAIAVLAETASGVADWLTLSRLCLDIDQPEAAAAWLQRARNEARDLQDKREVTAATVAFYLHRHDTAAAIDAQWALFTATLDAADLNPLENLGDHGIAVWQHRGTAEIKRQIDAATKQRGQAILYERLTRFYFDIGDVDAASRLASAHAIDSDLLALILQRQDDFGYAIPMAMRLARQWVESGDNQNYRRAVEVLADLHRRIDEPTVLRQFNDSLETLRQQLGSKRNFIKWLNDALRHTQVE